MQLPPQRYKFSLLLLKRAADILKVSNVYILNPRAIHCDNLLDADPEWERDLNLYLYSLKYYQDKRRPPAPDLTTSRSRRRR